MGTSTLGSTFSVTGGLAAKYIEAGQMIPWEGALALEGGEGTGDRRSIAKGALSHRDLPLPFMVQLTNPVAGDGHDGATLTGNITKLSKLDDGRWWGGGFIDPSMMDGETLTMALDRQLMRGVSIDLDQVETVDVATDKGNRQVITHGRIIGATACPFAAFAESEIHFCMDEMTPLAASGAVLPEGATVRVDLLNDAFETLIASAGSAIPVDPPGEWLTPIKFRELTPFTVLANGRVFGHIAARGTCHISFSGKCVPVPQSRTNYAAFRVASTLTAEGDLVRTGPLVMDTVHPDLRWQASDAMAFYADTGCAMADLVPYDDQFGLAVVGAMRPGTTPAQMRALRGSDFSPDWRTINGNPRECCAIVAVNNSGFKLPQTLVASAGMCIEPGESAVALDADGEVYALVASGPMSLEPCCAECAAHEHALVAGDVLDFPDEAELAARSAAVRSKFLPEQPPAKVFHIARGCRTSSYGEGVTDSKANHPSSSRRSFRLAAGAEFTGTSEGARKAHQTMGHVAGGKRFAKAASDRSAAVKQAGAKPAGESAYDKVLHAQSGKYAHMTDAQRAAADKLAADYQARPKGTKASFDKVSAALRAQGVKNPISYLADYADRRDAAHPSTPAEVDAVNAANQRMGAQAKAAERAAQVKPTLTPAAQAIKDKVPFLDDEAGRIAADDAFDKAWDESWDGELDNTESKLPPSAGKAKDGNGSMHINHRAVLPGHEVTLVENRPIKIAGKDVPHHTQSTATVKALHSDGTATVARADGTEDVVPFTAIVKVNSHTEPPKDTWKFKRPR